MENCLVTKLKSAVDNDSLNYLGYVKIHVNTQNDSANKYLNFLNIQNGSLNVAPVGSFLTGGKTFVNGKSKIDNGDAMNFAPGDIYELYVPKYSVIPIAPSVNGSDAYGRFSYNIDDYDFLPADKIQTDNSYIDTLLFRKTYDNTACSGNFEKVLGWMSPAVIISIDLSYSKVSMDISAGRIKNYSKLTYFNINSAINVTGNLRTFITNYMGTNKSALKARTNTLTFIFTNSNIDADVFSTSYSDSKILVIQFTGSSSITMQVKRSSTVVKSFNYDIDTDTLVQA